MFKGMLLYVGKAQRVISSRPGLFPLKYVIRSCNPLGKNGFSCAFRSVLRLSVPNDRQNGRLCVILSATYNAAGLYPVGYQIGFVFY